MEINLEIKIEDKTVRLTETKINRVRKIISS